MPLIKRPLSRRASLRLRSYLPNSLYGRAALILMMPVIVLQLLISVSFIQRHFEDVTEQLTSGIVLELQLIQMAHRAGGLDYAQAASEPLNIDVRKATGTELQSRRDFWDFSGRVVERVLRRGVAGIEAVDLRANPREVRIRLDAAPDPLELRIDRRRFSASNPHQLLVLMLLASVAMTLVAYVFMRNQLRPIKKLAQAAEAFGKGRSMPYRPRGASEVRAAGAAFMEMRDRIESQIEQRTLMLSGVSHDLRTPLTRIRLELAMLDPSPEIDAIEADLAEMERMLNGFLAFARGDAAEEAQSTNPRALLEMIVARAQRSGLNVQLRPGPPTPDMPMQAGSVTRAVENLINNAGRYADQAEVSLRVGPEDLTITVEDDGPGIPEAERARALRAFTRLDQSRNQNAGAGVGLGLAIAAEVASSHGGALQLGHSELLGGLKAELILAR